MPRASRFALLAVLGACGFPRPPTLTDDATPSDARADDAAPGGDGTPVDAAPIDSIPIDARPGTELRVAPTGDDANDGLTAPVKTLKRAIGLAAANNQIVSIALASGRYATAGGETFPYTVPPNVTIIGPAGGGAILAGSNAEPGVILTSGTLQDLELEDFTLAVEVKGTVQVTNVHIRTKATAMRAEMSAALTVENLDIAGAPGTCAAGVELSGSATLTATSLVTRALKTSVKAADQSAIVLVSAHLTGDENCLALPRGVILSSTTKTVSLKDSLIDAGIAGVSFVGTGTPARGTITNTTIKNLKESAIGANKVVLDVTGGELSNCDSAVGAQDANVTLTGVAVKQHRGFSVLLSRNGVFVMRGCTSTQNVGGIYLFDNMSVDLGTAASPGNNVFQNGTTNTLEIAPPLPAHVDAVGNTWRPNVQGANSSGHYATATILGPVGISGEGNFSVSSGSSLQL